MEVVEDPPLDGLGHITNRRKTKIRKPSSDGEEEDSVHNMDLASNRNPFGIKDDRSRQNLHAERQARQEEALARSRKLNAARKPSQEEVVAQSGIVASLLSAHMKAKIAITNCFDQKTVLDFIDKSCVERETMQDMAVAIDSASMVYGYRVDKTHLDAQDTRFTFIRGNNDEAGKAAEAISADGIAIDGDGEGAQKTRKRRGHNLVMDDDWQNRYHGLMEGDEERLSPERDAGDEEDEEDDTLDEDEDGEETDSESLNIREDLDQRLIKIKDQRKKKSSRIRVRNRMLEEDDDRLAMTSTQLSENDYYQKAVSKHSEGTAVSLLLHNARSSGDGRVMFMHSRVQKDDLPPVFDDDIRDYFLRGIRDSLCNALSATSARPANDMLPQVDEKPQLLFIRGGGVDGHGGYNPMMDSDDEEGEEEEAEMATEADSILPDETVMPDRTIMETTMMPATGPKTAKKTLRRRQRNRMRGTDITEMWISDRLDMPSTSVVPMNKSEMKRVSKRILNSMTAASRPSLIKEGIDAEELSMPIDDIWNQTKHAEYAGLDDDFRDIDCLWNSVVVEKAVDDDNCDQMLRLAEREGASADDVLARKKRVLRPGNYLFFMEPENALNRMIPVDPWSEEGAAAAGYDDMDDGNLDEFMDANDDSFDFGGGANDAADDMVTDDFPQMSSRTGMQSPSEEDAFVRSLIGLNTDDDEPDVDPMALLHAPQDDVADVPAADGITVNTDLALRSLGKLDDAHWKVNQTQPEKKERQKKEKLATDENKNDENYFVMSNEVDRAEALTRFKIAKANSLEKGEETLFSKRRATERRPYLAYKFENFTKPGLLFQGKYGGVRFERNISSHPEDAQFSKLLTKVNGTVDEEAGTEDVCKEWLSTFGGFRVFADMEDPTAGNESFHSAVDSQDGQDYGGGGMDFDDGGAGYDDGDSFHSAMQDPSSKAMQPRERTRHENLMYELQQVHGDESDEDEGEMVMMLDRKIVIKNSNIDQSRVKTYLKQILTNPTIGLDHLQHVQRVVDAEENGEGMEEVASTSSSEKENVVQNGGEKEKKLGAMDETGFDALNVTAAVYAPAEDLSQPEMFRRPSNAGEDPSTQMSSGVILSDFRVAGEHSMQSLYTCLPFKSTRPQERELHVAFAFSIALQMCNENTLHLEQRRPDDNELSGRSEDWMGDFVVRNASPQPAGTSSSSQAFSQKDNLLARHSVSSQPEH